MVNGTAVDRERELSSALTGSDGLLLTVGLESGKGRETAVATSSFSGVFSGVRASERVQKQKNTAVVAEKLAIAELLGMREMIR